MEFGDGFGSKGKEWETCLGRESWRKEGRMRMEKGL